MKKLITLATLLATSTTMASTSTTSIESNEKSFTDKISMWYYGEIDTDRFSKSEDEALSKNGTDFLNYLNIGYEISSTVKFDLTLRNGEYKIISFSAKKARGMMARYIIQNKIDKIKDLENFDLDNYKFDKSQSTETELVFTR